MAVDAAYMAESLRVSVEDVLVILGWEDVDPADIPKPGIQLLHNTLNPHCERTVPEVWGYTHL